MHCTTLNFNLKWIGYKIEPFVTKIKCYIKSWLIDNKQTNKQNCCFWAPASFAQNCSPCPGCPSAKQPLTIKTLTVNSTLLFHAHTKPQHKDRSGSSRLLVHTYSPVWMQWQFPSSSLDIKHMQLRWNTKKATRSHVHGLPGLCDVFHGHSYRLFRETSRSHWQPSRWWRRDLLVETS